jgi:hypothetical protein
MIRNILRRVEARWLEVLGTNDRRVLLLFLVTIFIVPWAFAPTYFFYEYRYSPLAILLPPTAFILVATLAIIQTFSSDPIVNLAGLERIVGRIQSTLISNDPFANEMLEKLHDYYARIGETSLFDGKLVMPSVTRRSSFYEPRDAAKLRRAIMAAVRAVSRDLAPSNFVLVVGTLVALALVGITALDRIYDPGPTATNSIVVLDQILKGFVVDISEYFDLHLASYTLPHERPHGLLDPVTLAGTGILFTLRSIPALVFFKALQLYQQRDAIERVILQLIIVDEDRLIAT